MTASVGSPVRVVAVVPEPTPYRAPLFDLIAERSDLDLFVIYAADAIAQNRWKVPIGHPHVTLRGLRLPGVGRPLRHDYPVTPGVWQALTRARPDVVVVSGWSTSHPRPRSYGAVCIASRMSCSSRATTRAPAPAGGGP